MIETLPIDRGKRELSPQSLKWTTPATLRRILTAIILEPCWSRAGHWPLPKHANATRGSTRGNE